MLGECWSNAREGVADFGHDEGQVATFAAAEFRDQYDQLVEVGLRCVGFVLGCWVGRNAGHDVDQGASHVEDLLGLERF